MVRASKSSEKVSVPTPVSNTTTTASAQKASKKPVKADATPAVVAPVAPAVVATSDVASDVSSLPVKMAEFNAKLQQLIGLFSTVKNDFKTLEKVVAREMKNAQKLSSKKRRNNGNRKPSGFIKPTRISDELAEFLGKTVGTEMARTEVSKEINTYIQTHGLQDKVNGRKIHPDVKLTKLLKINKDDELTYFNLQKFMKHHFVKADAPAVTA